MARIENGIVINIEWHSDTVIQNNTLVDIEDKPVNIGNSYVDGKFYDNGIEVLTEKEHMEKLITEYKESLLELGVEV